ncbi:hypothetical protein, partial [Actinocrinis puniceicyclus]|uniref:hypothetical protein n=1 Tax=Actinocrinis puniceicyclus TaxID=977794 RepID=UPI002484BCAF
VRVGAAAAVLAVAAMAAGELAVAAATEAAVGVTVAAMAAGEPEVAAATEAAVAMAAAATLLVVAAART